MAKDNLNRLVIFGYLLATSTIAVFSHFVFGSGFSLGICLLLLLPLPVCYRMSSRFGNSKRVTVVAALGFMCFSMMATAGLIWNMYELGMHLRHAEDLQSVAFRQALRSDPAFQKVDIFVTAKHIFWIQGSVASKDDLERLRALAANCTAIDWNEEVEVNPAW